MTSGFETNMSQFSPDMSATFQRSGGRSRTHSISSDRPSTVSQSVMSPPLSVSPEAAFIAASAASQIVTNDHDSHADTWYDQHGFQPSGEPVVVAYAALCQLNNFLDHLLFNFLAVSGSTSLAKLRLAVVEVLKPKLAKDAINNADEELREYLGGGDDEEFLQSPTSPSPQDWDLELVWKRTRLRCMVYSSLGDMEEEDEDHHMEEGLLGDDENGMDNVSPAVAIFLTSILEYLGEQALISAGQAAWHRTRVRYEKEMKDYAKGRSDIIDRIVVEELDMERVALDRTLGRLWRAWKKRVRSGPTSIELSHRPLSREKMYHLRLGSLASPDGAVPPVQEAMNEPEEEAQRDATVVEMNDVDRAAAIPLPMGRRDTDEIEVPGLVHYSDDESEEETPELDLGIRPKSIMIFPFASHDEPPTPSMSQPQTPAGPGRRRANSLPTPAASPYDKRNKSPESQDDLEMATKTDSDEQGVVVEPEITDPVTAAKDSQPLAEVEDQEGDVTVDGKTNGASPDALGASVGAAASAANVPVEDDDDLEEIEEAQILTSSRISIGGSVSGRSDSPANSERSTRPPLSLHTLPVRSGSLRLVDVASPRTPPARSQRSSMLQDAAGPSYSRATSRTSSTHTQSNSDEAREMDEPRALRISSTSSLGKGRNNVKEPISEAAEVDELNRRPALSATLPSTVGPRKDPASAPEDRVILTPDEFGEHEQKKSRRQATQPLFGSVKRQSPTSPHRPSVGEVEQQQSRRSPVHVATALGTPPDSATFLEDDVGPLPQRYPRQSPRQFASTSSPIGPTVPEKNASRSHHAHSHSAGNTQQQQGTIGIVSVDRSANKEPNDVTRSSVDQNTVRPFHTPASSISSHKLRGPRASTDSTATRPEDVARNFEELIHSDETIQYTLTPENMREIEGSPRSLQSGMSKTKTGEDARQTSRDRAASSAKSTKSTKPIEVRRSASITRATGLRSHPVDIAAEEKARPPPVSMSNRNRGAVPQAREAKIPRESVLEFAEFIRATGPPGADKPPSVQPSAGLRRNPSLMRDGPPAPPAKPSIDHGRPSMGGSVSRARLQARDATIDNSNDNSDLIDFIRRGPPSSGNPRIPRTVAPFRTTMDSDQMSAAVGGRANDLQLSEHDMRYSQASTNVTEMSAPSVQSSLNSQSALLGRKQLTPQNSMFDEQDMMPARKQRRVRDPYALDFSDEEEEDDFDYQPQPSRKVQPKEESLIDFLNSVPPPPPSQPPVPFNLSRTQTMPTKAPAPKKKASAPSLMSRFRQNSAAGNNNGRGPRSPTDARSMSSRAGPAPSKGYIPIQVNIPTGDLYPSYGSSTTPAMPSVPSQFSSRPTGRVPMKKFEPRDAVSVPSRGTSDLAEFLKYSEPPSMSGPGAPDPVEVNTTKLFGRRKKSTGFA